jgi:hypothetical protein
LLLRLAQDGFRIPLQPIAVIMLDAAQDFRVDVQRIDVLKGLVAEARMQLAFPRLVLPYTLAWFAVGGTTLFGTV